jgi:hypothetical protein
MVFLLTNYSSIFLKLQNGCYIQLTGPAISKLLISSNLSSFTSMASNFYTLGQITQKIQEVTHFEKEKIVAKINDDTIALDENLGTQKRHPITDVQGTSSKANNNLKRKHPNEDVERPTFKVTVLNERDVVKVFLIQILYRICIFLGQLCFLVLQFIINMMNSGMVFQKSVCIKRFLINFLINNKY